MTSETEGEARERRRQASYLYGWGPELPGHSASRGQHEAARHFFAGMEAEAPIARQAERAAVLGAIRRRMREVARDIGLEEGWEELESLFSFIDRGGHIEASAHTEEE